MNGLAGNDVLNAGASDDTLIGGAGNDTLKGDIGNDTYVFSRGDGADTVFDYYTYTYSSYEQTGSDGEGNPTYGYVDRTATGDGGADTLTFGSGISASDIVITMSGNDLIVGVKDPANPSQTFAQLTD